MHRILPLVLSGLWLWGCVAPDAREPRLEGPSWRLIELDGAPLSLPAEARTPFIAFDATAGTASGYGGCNRFQGGYRWRDGALQFGPIAATRRACGDLLDRVESAFFKVLGTGPQARVTGTTLELSDRGAVRARLRRQE